MKPEKTPPKPQELAASKRRPDRDDIRARTKSFSAPRQSLRPVERSDQDRPHHS